MDNIREEMVQQFMDLTQSSVRKAEQYLTLSDFNIESAIQLFFDNGGADLEGPSGSGGGGASGSASAGQGSHGRGGSERDAIQVDEGDDPNHGYQEIGEGSLEDWRNASSSEERQERLLRQAQRNRGTRATGSGSPSPPAVTGGGSAGGNQTFDDDEAMARRLQEEAWSDMAGGGADLGGFAGDSVRAPIAKTRETLVGPDDDYIRRMMDARNYRQSQRGSSSRPGIFNQRNVGSSSIWDDEEGSSSVAMRRRLQAEATGGRSEFSSKSSQLAAMFRPPFEIMSNIGLDDARDKAREEEKWILVNIQDQEFPSQMLNRDLWKDEAIKATIKENFVFLQHSKDSPDGIDYIRLYMTGQIYTEFPHIAILDPRTGEQLKVWTSVPEKAEFLMQLHEFLERYSLSHDAKNPVQTVAKPKTLNVDAMTEDEMLQLALQNSLGNNEDAQNGYGPDELTNKTKKKAEEEEDLMRFDDEPQNTEGSSSATAPAGADSATAPTQVSPFGQITSDAHHIEPAPNAPNVTRVQLRLSDGTRVVRRFELSDPVRRIFEYVKADLLPELAKKEGNVELSSGEEREFELRSLKQNLIEVLDSTIEEAGLKMGTVMVEFVEE